MQAQHDQVRNAVVGVLMQSAEARASLERAFAQNGLSVRLTQMDTQGQPALLPAAAAAESHRVEIKDVTDGECEERMPGGLQNLIDSIVRSLGTLGDNVTGALRGIISRWKRRFDRIFNPGMRPSLLSFTRFNLQANAFLCAYIAHMLQVPLTMSAPIAKMTKKDQFCSMLSQRPPL